MTYIQQRVAEALESRTSTNIKKALAGRLKPSNIEIINNLKKEGKKYVN